MGISPMTAHDIGGRPFYATEDGKGRVVKEIFVWAGSGERRLTLEPRKRIKGHALQS